MTESEENRARLASWVADLERLAVETDNPLYLWEAILRCLAGDLPLPTRSTGYLSYVAHNLFDLAHGRDFRHPIAKEVHETDEEFGFRLHAHYDAGDLQSDRALALVPEALGLVRKGKKNAFAARETDRKAINGASRVYAAEVLDDGGKMAERINEIEKSHNVSTDWAKRIVAKGKKLARLPKLKPRPR